MQRLSGVKLAEPNGVAVSATGGRAYVADSARARVRVQLGWAYEAQDHGVRLTAGVFSR